MSYPNVMAGETTLMPWRYAMTDTAVLRPTPDLPAMRSDPPGDVKTRSTRAIDSST